MATVIEAQRLSKRFTLIHNRSESLKERFLALFHRDKRQVSEDFWALKNVSLTVRSGETVGLVGRNGSGKSTLLKLIAGIHRPSSGRLLVARHARIGTMIELGVAFHQELTGQENVFLNAAIHGLSRRQIAKVYEQIVEYSGLQHFIDVPLKNYSAGMQMRLGFAVAANLDPDILLLDEIFSVGDELFRQRCTETMLRFAAEGKTILFVSHDAETIQKLCRRVWVLDRGELVYDGPTEAGLDEYHRRISAEAPRYVEGPEFAAARPARP